MDCSDLGIAECEHLDGYTCNTTGCFTICGDGIVVTPEECDDGGSGNGDGCSADCKAEDHWTCQLYYNDSASPLQPLPKCFC